MKLKDVLRDVPVRATHGDLDLEISAVTSDSRLAVRGSLFVAIPGTKDDGSKYVDNAVEKGAVAVASERPLAARRSPLASFEPDDAGAALAPIAATSHGRPPG